MVSITFEDQVIHARATDSVAAALFATGINMTRRTPVSDSPRGAYCMMGVCFECLTEINGVPNKQACMIRVSEGMVIKRMQGARSIVDKPPTSTTSVSVDDAPTSKSQQEDKA